MADKKQQEAKPPEPTHIVQCMLTTVDNPFDPFTSPDEWEVYDRQKGYLSPQYLARVAHVSTELSDELFHREIERAIDEIIEFNPLGIYKKVSRRVAIADMTIPE